MKTSFTDLIIEIINSHEPLFKEYFLQLASNVMYDEHNLRNLMRKRVDFELLTEEGEIYAVLVEDFKKLCEM